MAKSPLQVATITAISLLILTYIAIHVLNLRPKDGEQFTVNTVGNEYPNNTLLKMNKSEISRLYPGNCFAEIYLKDPSFGGRLVGSCLKKTAQQVKALTGLEVRENDLIDPQYVGHLKDVFGRGNPWRR